MQQQKNNKKKHFEFYFNILKNYEQSSVFRIIFHLSYISNNS